ncbi:MAG: protein BatD [Verrucomicrobiales bacterium]|nr:protein BatD [Verrucomicrobiales bacterium]
MSRSPFAMKRDARSYSSGNGKWEIPSHTGHPRLDVLAPCPESLSIPRFPLPHPLFPRPFAFLACVLVWLGLTGLAHAASINLTLDRDMIGLGDSATLKVTVEGGSGRDSPQVPEVPGLRFTPTGTSMSFAFVNGRQSVTSDSSYTITATKLGEYTIGPVRVTVGGRVIESGIVLLKVLRADDPAAARADGLDKAAFLVLQLPERDIYVGETFVAEVHLYAIGGRLQQAPQLQADGFVLGKIQDAGQEGNIRTNNRIYSRARFQQPVTAARSGDLTLQALNCILDIPVARRPGFSDVFDDAFFGLRENKRFNLFSPPTTIRVQPLPRDNVPPSFSGAVGEFEVAMAATPTNLNAGDPITVRVEIRGRGNFDGVQMPEPADWKSFRTYPATANFEPADAMGLSGTKRFEQVVTPESEDIRELPALTFSYFSPTAKSYRTARSPAIPLKVGTGAAAAVLPVAANQPRPTNGPAPELAALKPHLGAVLNPDQPWIRQPWFLALSLFPWATWAGLNAWRRWKDRLLSDQRAVRRRQLERQADEGLAALAKLGRDGQADAFYSTLFRVLQEMIGARLGLEPASITEGILETPAALDGLPQDCLEPLHQLFQACNQARYARGPGAGDLESLRLAASQVAAALKSP